MKQYLFIIILALGTLAISMPDLAAQDSVRNKQKVTEHQKQQQQQFVDADGDGYNDNAPDHDGDGIPNRLDPDWKKKKKKERKNVPFVDLNGDGVNDNIQPEDRDKSGQQKNMKSGEGDGSSVKAQEQNRGQKGKKGKN